MRPIAVAGVGSVAALAAMLFMQANRSLPVSEQESYLRSYCVDCHNPIELNGDLDLTSIDLTDVTRDREAWESAIRKLRIGMPVGTVGGGRGGGAPNEEVLALFAEFGFSSE